MTIVFAGHGDVSEGEGFIELEDGRLTAGELRAWLTRIDADETRLILDSCNSYAMLAPRKPGGKRFTTPKELAQQVADTLPKVGVFLSTSANAESYEWSELQSGIFSHIVRSGLAGAADANGDGAISYRELRAFVAIATGSVKNPALRPQVMARGPAGADDRALFRPSGEGVAISGSAAEPLRLTFRDVNGVRWLDANFAAGERFVLRVPTTLAAGMSVLTSTGERVVPAGATLLAFDELPAAPARGFLARGVDASLSALFATPFSAEGAAAVEREAALNDSLPAAPLLLGVSDENFAQLGTVLEGLARVDASRRYVGAATQVAIGISALAVGSASLIREVNDPASDASLATTLSGVSVASVGALSLGLSVWSGSRRLESEIFYESVWRAPTDDRLALVARAEGLLTNWRRDDEASRAVIRSMAYVLTGTSALVLVAGLVLAAETNTGFVNVLTVVGALSGVLAGQLIIDQSSLDPRRQLLEQWFNGKPPNRTVNVTVSPAVLSRGLGVAVTGRF